MWVSGSTATAVRAVAYGHGGGDGPLDPSITDTVSSLVFGDVDGVGAGSTAILASRPLPTGRWALIVYVDPSITDTVSSSLPPFWLAA